MRIPIDTIHDPVFMPILTRLQIQVHKIHVIKKVMGAKPKLVKEV
jgi:hypothetical protein